LGQAIFPRFFRKGVGSLGEPFFEFIETPNGPDGFPFFDVVEDAITTD
jgi:hypothetical protein